jgi:hypothetical protein
MSKLFWASLFGLCAFGGANANPHKILHCTHGSPVFMPYGAVHYGAPAYGAPVYGAPVYGAPVYGAPVYGAPVYGAAAYGAPVYGAPVYGADGKLLKTAANVALAYFHLPLLPAAAGGGNQGSDGGDDDLRKTGAGGKPAAGAADLTQKKLDAILLGLKAIQDNQYTVDSGKKLPVPTAPAPLESNQAFLKALEDLKKLNKE